jgi:GNAT superfamily N-acetyltransferase
MATIVVRAIRREDYVEWRLLWEGYNAFYGRSDRNALPEEISASTWERFFNPVEPVFALVAERDGQLAGLVHYIFHRSTTKLAPVCYLQDLFTKLEHRGNGVGRALIEAVYDEARKAGAQRVYWHTQVTNTPARALYDKIAEHQGFIVYTRDPL